jgi:hypothetical protein
MGYGGKKFFSRFYPRLVKFLSFCLRNTKTHERTIHTIKRSLLQSNNELTLFTYLYITLDYLYIYGVYGVLYGFKYWYIRLFCDTRCKKQWCDMVRMVCILGK